MAKVTFKSNLDVILKATHEQVSKAAEIIAAKAEQYAKELCPVDTGALKESIRHKVKDDGHTAVIYTEKPYSVYVELGTGRFAENGNGRQTPWVYKDAHGQWHTTIGMRPQPYMRPALDDHHDEWRNVIEQCVRGKGMY